MLYPPFLAPPEEYCLLEKSFYHILPVPYDGTSSWQKGADKGPLSLLKASSQIEFYDLETNSEAYLAGIFTSQKRLDLSSPEKMVTSVKEEITSILANSQFPIIVGGEHSVSIGAIFALADIYSEFTIVQLDAHADLRDNYQGSIYNHACVMARAKEKNPIVQIGIRSADKEELTKANPRTFFPAHLGVEGKNWLKKALAVCSENIYLTIDLDVFDPAIMPSTGTPEPGGLGWYEVLDLLKLLIAEKNLLGFDVVELCPNGQPHAEFLAAKLVYKIITYHQLKVQKLISA